MPKDCTRHLTGNVSYVSESCPICKLEVEVSRIFAAEMPRYRFWRIKRTAGSSPRDFEYTTETAQQGKYWAIERRWVRVKGGERGKIIRMVGFKVRAKAKARAFQWYEKARATRVATTAGIASVV